MRLALAIGAAVGAGIGASLLLAKFHDKLPSFVVADNAVGHGLYGALVTVPGLVAYAIIGGVKSSASPVPLPPTK
jgi:hypothetical protein